MRFLRPRSLTNLLASGLTLIAVPLIAAILYGGYELQRLSAESQRLLRTSVEATRLTQTMFEQIAAMERSANLHAVLRDPRLLEAFSSNHSRFMRSIRALGRVMPDPAVIRRIEGVGHVAGATLRISAADQPTDVAVTQRAFEELNVAATGMAAEIRQKIDGRLQQLEGQAQVTRSRLLWILSLLIPAALLFSVLFVLYVIRPLRAFDRAIAELGRGTFSRQIAIHGPSDLEALGGQLEWLRTRLLELAQEKNRFLRHMSHELKTPLANIREGTDLLLEDAVGVLPESQREIVEILRENALSLQRLIENLLSFSAWQSRSVGLELSEFQLRSIVKSVIDTQRLAIVAHRLRLDLAIADLRLQADRGKLRLVFDNLLSNALNYTPRNGVIHVHARAEGENCVIDFADSGPGIPKAERGRIFEAFQTGNALHSGPLKGTGIGLSVVLEFMQVHGGSVEIIDGEFPGAHFRLTLPLRQATHGVDSNAA
jgi:two-component system sensor histidine kinase GlrK